MDIVFTLSDNTTETVSVLSDGEIYQTIANYIGKQIAPKTVYVNTPCGDAEFQLIAKGGAFFVREAYNNITISDNKPVKPVYLVMVNPEYNNYKFYKLEDASAGQILATYGRIGASSNEVFGERTHYYPRHMYWIKLLEKLGKGYKDMTDIYLTGETVNNETSHEEMQCSDNSPSTTLYRLLKSYSTYVVEKSCLSVNITSKMVETTKKLLNELYGITDNVDLFNEKLLKILEVSPRKIRSIKLLLASSIEDFEKIISREESLLMAMEAIANNDVNKPTVASKTGFSKQGIEVYAATEKQKQEVIEHLSGQLKNKVKNIYRVIVPEQKTRFNNYLKQNNIGVVKQYWHGSKNCNWLSIISNGLLLKPNAQITGKMLGNGIYFASSSQKSWGYTSAHNTYWANGNSDTAFMGLYACAYGTPLDVSTPGYYDEDMLKRKGCNCVHAHAGNYLRNDEIVFYNEDAMLLNYIVEFEG